MTAAMARMFVFGMGYTAQRLAARLRGDGWQVDGTGSAGNTDFDDRAAVQAGLARASHILSSVPPNRNSGEDDVLRLYGEAIAQAPAAWIGYLSSTGVYGDADGAWVDESAPIGEGRRTARATADAAWQALDDCVCIFRLPGIYGPGRSALDRVRAGTAHRIDLPGQIFSRVHVDDIAGGVIAAFGAPPGVYNLSDDRPASHNAVTEEACRLLGVPPPPLQTMEQAGLSPMARGFYAENRRVANGKAKRVLGWEPEYPDYRGGLRAIRAAEASPE